MSRPFRCLISACEGMKAVYIRVCLTKGQCHARSLTRLRFQSLFGVFQDSSFGEPIFSWLCISSIKHGSQDSRSVFPFCEVSYVAFPTRHSYCSSLLWSLQPWEGSLRTENPMENIESSELMPCSLNFFFESIQEKTARAMM